LCVCRLNMLSNALQTVLTVGLFILSCDLLRPRRHWSIRYRSILFHKWGAACRPVTGYRPKLHLGPSSSITIRWE